MTTSLRWTVDTVVTGDLPIDPGGNYFYSTSKGQSLEQIGGVEGSHKTPSREVTVCF